MAIWMKPRPAKERQKPIRRTDKPIYMQKHCRICGQSTSGADICQSCASYVKMMNGEKG